MKNRKAIRAKAIVIGINNYEQANTLNNAVNDAQAISDALKKLKFYVDDYYDVTTDEWDKFFDEFCANLKDFDVCVLYFAGHGIEMDGKNYLLCKETPSESKAGIERHSIDLQKCINDLKNSGCPTNILIIDACRNNPFPEGRAPFATANPAPIYAPKGTLIAFSTSPGEKASDGGLENHSSYTRALLNHIFELGLPIESFFKKVRTTLYNLSGEKQTSWEHTSLIGDFSFNSGQLIQNLNIGNYADKVIRRELYDFSTQQTAQIVQGLLSTQFNENRDALKQMCSLNMLSLEKDEQFMLGRCCMLAAIRNCYDCQDLFKNNETLTDYSVKGDNHFLNGALFELYFDENGTLRERVSLDMLESIIQHRNHAVLRSSFDYIHNVLLPLSRHLYFIPSPHAQKVSIDIIFEVENRQMPWGMEECAVVKSIRHDVDDLSELFVSSKTYLSLTDFKKELASLISTPSDFLQINCNIDVAQKTIVLKKDFVL